MQKKVKEDPLGKKENAQIRHSIEGVGDHN
jgi:hypothetical protein